MLIIALRAIIVFFILNNFDFICIFFLSFFLFFFFFFFFFVFLVIVHILCFQPGSGQSARFLLLFNWTSILCWIEFEFVFRYCPYMFVFRKKKIFFFNKKTNKIYVMSMSMMMMMISLTLLWFYHKNCCHCLDCFM